MESTNNDDLQLQHHNLQDHLARSSSIIPSSLAFPSLSDVEGNCEHAWRSSSTFFLNNIHANSIEAPPNTFNNSMIQDLRYSLPNNINNIIQSTSYDNEHHHQHLISNKIKEESSTSSDQSNSSSFQTFGELLSPSTNTPSEMLLLNTLSPTYKNHMFHPSTYQPNMQFQDNSNNSDLLSGITTFSQIFPSVNISKLSSSAMDSSNFRGNLDLIATQRSFLGGRSLNNQAPNSNLLELFKDSSHQYGNVDHDLQQSNDLRLCNASTHLSSFNNNGILEPKRSSCIVEPNSSHQSASKKQRFETRASCPPFKVRKEKLGDRIAALQQLVAPFGKTDTASVLSEAIGYIKFLQNQIETLSVPYMKLGSRNRSSNNLHRIPDENEANKQDLKSRGLCLVPLTCMSYIATDCEITGPSAWPPHHNFNPGF